MRYFLILLGCCFLQPHALFAQQFTGAIVGKISDKDTRQPIAGVNVLLMNSDPLVGAISDEEGKFRIDSVSVGRRTLRITYIGYEDVLLNELEVSSGKETVLNIEMQGKVTDLKEVVVSGEKDKTKANNDFADVSVRTFSAEEMSRYAGTLNDPARMAQSFAGVMTSDDENNQIVVRGNSPRGLLWRMEGIEIPNPNHFAGSEGSTGGGVSMLSANMLTKTDFFSGAFPAEYGNALSGIFDLNLRRGNSEKREFAFQAGVLGLEAALEGPFSRKYSGSYLINYRYSTLDILSILGLKIGGNVVPKYQDLSFNFYFPTKNAGTFTLFGLGGLSSLGEKAVRDTVQWKTFSDKSEFNLAQRLGVAGITHLFLLKDNKTYVKSVLSYSYTNNESTDDTLADDFVKFNLADNKFIYQTVRGSIMANSKLDSKNTIRIGLTYSHINYKLYSDEYSYLQQQQVVLVNNLGNTSLFEAYGQYKHRFSDVFQLNGGLHFTYSAINSRFYFEPRIGAEWRLKKAHTLTIGAGLHSRIDAMSTYVSYQSSTPGASFPNKRLDFTRAFHGVVGYNFSFLKDFHVKVEAYAQYLFHVPVGTDSANGTYSILNYNEGFVNIPLQNQGVGYNYGIELTVEKFFSKHYFFMFTGSLFNSKYRAFDGQWRNTAYNVNYVMNALGGKEFVVGKKKNNSVSINAKVVWRGGQRTTPIDLTQSISANETVYSNTEVFSKRLPDYFRVDFGANYKRNKKKYSWTLSFDAQNVINRQNVAREAYDADTQTIVIEKNLGIVPVLSWKIEFSTGRPSIFVVGTIHEPQLLRSQMDIAFLQVAPMEL